MAFRYDLIVRNATVVDGTGAQRFVGDIAVNDDRIALVGAIGKARAITEIDATGKVAAPGFIDAHAHDDRALLSGPEMRPKVSQGVTTVITGNCGISLAPLIRGPNEVIPPPIDLLGDGQWFRYPTFSAYRDALGANPAAVNSACMVGHTTL